MAGSRIDAAVHRSRSPVRSCAYRIRRAGLTPLPLAQIALVLTAIAAVWFAGGDRRGALVGSAVLLAVLAVDAVAVEMSEGSATSRWPAATLRSPREFLLYAGLAVGGGLAGVSHIWAWASGAVIVHGIRQTARTVPRVPPGLGPGACGRAERVSSEPRLSPVITADPSRQETSEPSDESLVEEILGGTAPSRNGTGERPHGRSGRRVATVVARARRSVARPAARSARLWGFPQWQRFAVVAFATTVWDAQVAFLALIAGGGCALGVSAAAWAMRKAAG